MNTHLLNAWLCDHFKSADFNLTPLAGDASFRLYFRVIYKGTTYIAMDASAEREKCPQFVAIAEALHKQKVCTPKIFAKALQAGFLLLSDFGDDQLLKVITLGNRESMYRHALDTLALISTCKEVSGYTIPHFTAHFMREELNWFQEWFLEKYLELTLSFDMRSKLASCFDLLAQSCAAQAYVFMHRDYHSANLMLLKNNEIGVLDFQDAFIGPVTYDLVSLLRDCYIDLPQALVNQLVLQYRDKLALSVSDEEFTRWFDWMGIQRHLKALMTFSRKYCRDNNAHYLQYIPRTLNYVLQASACYSEYAELNHFLRSISSVEKCQYSVE